MKHLVPALLLLAGPASATDAFDPNLPAAVFAGADPLLQDAEGLPTWDRVERLVDGDALLFAQEDFAPGSAWDDDSPMAPHAAALFGDPEPHSGTALLHMAPGWLDAEHPVPVLLVPGAGTSASGVLVVLARQLAAEGRAVFALSFAHPHGDVFQQAEHVANALARISALTDADQTDLIAHSKGGIAAAVHLAHRDDADWGSSGRAVAYTGQGTPHRGDVRRFVAVATPFGGLDTPFRWTAPHLPVLEGEMDPLAPVPWHTWYPLGAANVLVSEDVSAWNAWPEGGDAFPGTAQILARWDKDHPLPGDRPELGAYALQQDWATAYDGGLGFFGHGDGIDSAIAAGGEVLEHLATNRLPDSVEVVSLAGSFPFVALDRPAIAIDPFGGSYGDFLGRGDTFYADFFADVLADDFPNLTLDEDDLQGLREGWLAPGEITGASDGVVFAGSVEAINDLLPEGAELFASRTVELSHLDLLFASEALGEALIAQGEADPDRRYLRALGQRWVEADTVSWLVDVLGDVPPGDDDDSAGDDDDSAADDDDATGDDDDDSAGGETPDSPFVDGCGCGQGGGGGGWLGALLLLALIRRSRS